MIVLVINSGSSSVKFQLFKMPEEKMLIKGSAEKNGDGNTDFTFQLPENKKSDALNGFSYDDIFNRILKELKNPENRVLNSPKDLDVVGHRLIHGAEKSESCVEITNDLMVFMKSKIDLAPLHYPPNLKGIEAIKRLLPNTLQTGVFDTAFHHSIPEKAFLYGLPLKWYKNENIRRYGFHGTSHKYVAQRASKLAGIKIANSKIISCHLGNGASVAAIKNGKSVDTSMGLTPVEGLIMGTRCGDIDAGVLLHLQKNYNLSAEELDDLINRKSGLLGLSEVSSDFRKVQEAASKGNKEAMVAMEVYCYRIQKYIGAYLAVLQGTDILVFTGGIGENSSLVRDKVCSKMEWAGIKYLRSLNEQINGKEGEISSSDSKVKVLVVPTNEELMIARESAALVESKL